MEIFENSFFFFKKKRKYLIDMSDCYKISANHFSDVLIPNVSGAKNLFANNIEVMANAILYNNE